ncbi:MAG: hypothetical protein JKX97_03825 [Candidatus Lindowbacteria bacterium]|nr:hypothetical protein [Candidatus Lindowbacteria bacterium]
MGSEEQGGKGSTDTFKSIVGSVDIDKDEHRKCLNCIRYRPTHQNPGNGLCTRTLFADDGKFLGRANENVTEDYFCDQFASRFGEQQQ